ncbi:chaperone modulator CbpM [Desulfonatronospira sp.]|uniref:chaperone modulator CbpM n=1 Tax=Desulfonatronospira sp. TaxID=1962951 RepID=UPI0025C5DE9D|nr:chaperone modulator CbpM [Desulfonatronospira sp.]
MSNYIQTRRQGTLIRANLIHWSQFVQRTGVCPGMLGELVEMGWVESICTSPESYHFPEKEVFRVQKLVRLCRDFELPTIGGVLIIDLLDRIEQQDKEIRQLRRLI